MDNARHQTPREYRPYNPDSHRTNEEQPRGGGDVQPTPALRNTLHVPIRCPSPPCPLFSVPDDARNWHNKTPARSEVEKLTPSDGVPSNLHLLNGAHDFSLGTANWNVAGRDVHLHLGQRDNTAVEVWEIALWLTSTNQRNYHNTTVSLRAVNTGTWFFETREFEEWEAAECATLWITGMPGAGKTILASHSVDRLQAISERGLKVTIVYFYCRYIDNCTARDLLATLIRQLLENHGGEEHNEVYTIVRTVYDWHKRRQISLTATTAIGILGAIAALFKKFYVVLDGLDEMPENEKVGVLDFFKTLPSHLLIFSRPMEAFYSILPNVATLSISARNGDIEACVIGRIKSNYRLRRLLQDDQPAIHTVVEKIQLKSCGMFLLASLQLEALAGCTNIASLMAALETLPTGLDDMYAWTLHRILSQPHEEALLVQKVLLWLTHSKRALEMVELMHALATSYDADGKGFDALNMTPADIILTACCGLVTTGPVERNQMVSPKSEPPGTEVRLIHYTTLEYLQRLTNPPFADFAAITTFTCLAYISSISKRVNRSLGDEAYTSYAFISYALTYWSEHMKNMDFSEDERLLDKLCCILDGIPGLPCDRCGNLDARHTPFQFAVCRDLLMLLPRLQCDDEAVPGSESVSSYNSLHLAIHLRRPAAVQALIHGPRRSPVNIEVYDGTGRTPLIHAIAQKDIHIIELLLSHPDIDTNMPDIHGSTPLFTAMQYDRHDIIQKLLGHPKCDPNRRIVGTFPLEKISEWTRLQVGWEQGAPLLLFASLCGKRAIVDALVEHPDTDVNARTDNGDHALSWLIPDYQILSKFPPQSEGIFNSFKSSSLGERMHAVIPILSHPCFDPALLEHEAGSTPLLVLASRAGSEGLVQALLPFLAPRLQSAVRSTPTSTPRATVPTPARPLWRSVLKLFRPAPPDPLKHAQELGREEVTEPTLKKPIVNANAGDRWGKTALYHARSLSMLKLLLSSPHLNPNHQDVYGNTCLIYACNSKDVPVVLLLLQRGDIALHVPNHEGITALMVATKNTFGSSSQLVRLLVEHPNFSKGHDSDINKQDAQGMSALHWAVHAGEPYRATPPQADALACLLPLPRLNINLPNRAADTPMHLAAYHGAPAIITALLNHPDIEVNMLNQHGDTPLHIVCKHSHIEACTSLLQHPNTNMNIVDGHGNTPLHVACQHADIKVCEALLQRPEIDVNRQNGDGETPLHIACRHSRPEVSVSLLRCPGLDVSMKNRQGNCAIHLAAKQGEVAIVNALLMHRATNPNIQNTAKSTPLHIACQFSRVHAALVLLLHPDLVVAVRDSTGNCAIHVAAEQGDAHILQTLFGHHDPNLPNAAGNAPIHIVCQRNHTIAALSLIKNPQIDINALNRTGNAAIHIATENGHAPMVHAILRSGTINPNLVNAVGLAPLHIAARLSTRRSGPVLAALLSDPRIDVNLRDGEGYTAVDILSRHVDRRPLQLALAHPSIEANPLDYRRNFYSSCWRIIYLPGPPRQRASDWRRISSFLQYDPGSVRFTDANGMTVLHHAAKAGCEELVERILAEFWAWVEVDLWLCDKEGKSVMDYAGEGPIARMLGAAKPSWFCLFDDN